MKYTIEQVGTRWVASDGATHVEADDPGEAVFRLLCANEEVSQGLSGSAEEYTDHCVIDELEDTIGVSAIRIVRLVAMRAPPAVLLPSVKRLADTVERFIESGGCEQ